MATTLVSTPAALKAALAEAAAYDVIELAPGVYAGDTIAMTGPHVAGLMLSGFKFPAGEVTVLGQPGAVLPGLGVASCQGLHFAGLEFDLPATVPTAAQMANGQPASAFSYIQFGGCADVVLKSSLVKGPAGGVLANTPSGVLARGCTGFKVKKVEFVGLHKSMQFVDSQRVTVNENFAHGGFDDFIDNVGGSNFAVVGNRVQNMHTDVADTDHPDCCQFWTDTGGALTDLDFADNFFGRGPTGQPIQGWPFLQNLTGTATVPFAYHQRVSATLNIVAGGDANAFTFGGVEGLLAAGNIGVADPRAVLTGTLQVVKPSLLIDGCTGVTVSGNQAAGFHLDPWSAKARPSQAVSGFTAAGALTLGNALTQPYSDGGAALLAAWLARGPRHFGTTYLGA